MQSNAADWSLATRIVDLTSLKLCSYLSMVGLSTVKHQHSKKLTQWIEATWTKNTWKCKFFARVCSQKCSECPPFAWTHGWRRFIHWSTAVSIMTCRKSGPYRN